MHPKNKRVNCYLQGGRLGVLCSVIAVKEERRQNQILFGAVKQLEMRHVEGILFNA